jgi:hypothetical protein
MIEYKKKDLYFRGQVNFYKWIKKKAPFKIKQANKNFIIYT